MCREINRTHQCQRCHKVLRDSKGSRVVVREVELCNWVRENDKEQGACGQKRTETGPGLEVHVCHMCYQFLELMPVMRAWEEEKRREREEQELLKKDNGGEEGSGPIQRSNHER